MGIYGLNATLRTMATEATFTVPTNQFPLGTVFEQLPDVTVTLERIIPAQDVVVRSPPTSPATSNPHAR